MSKKYRVKLFGLGIATFMIMLTGCGLKREQEIITKPPETYKVCDLSKMQQTLVIGGKEVGFPFELKDLPDIYTEKLSEDGFTYDKLEGVTEDNRIIGKGEYSIDVQVKCKKKENLIDDGKVCYVGYSEVEGTTNNAFSVDGIGCDNTIEEAVDRFGEPSTIEEISENNYCAIEYKQDNDTSVVFISLDGVSIQQMYLTCGIK